MPEIPDYQTLMLPILRYAAEGDTTIPKAVERIAIDFNLDDDQLAQLLPSGTPIVNNRAHWAKTYLSKAGLIEVPRRGVFRLTPRGKSILSKNPQYIDNKLLAKFKEFLDFVKETSPSIDTSSSADTSPNMSEMAITNALSEITPPDERIEDAAREIAATLRTALLDRIFSVNPPNTRARFFERLVIKLLVAMGYGGGRDESAFHIGGRGDGGIDGVIHQDALGLDPIYVQAKCYDRSAVIGPDKIREFKGALEDKGASRGVFITTARFSEAARRPGRASQKQVVLIDGAELADLMIRFSVGVQVHQTIVVKRVDEDFFEA